MYKTLFQITILGSSGAMPTSSRHTTAQLLKHDNKLFLIDCSEGTQIQLQRMNIPLMKINHIFITHFHGDHYLGLPGLLFTMHLLGRTKELNIYSPPGLKEIIEKHFNICNLKTSYKIIYNEIAKGRTTIYEDTTLKADTIKMLHSIPAYGFLFEEKPLERNIKKEYVRKYNIPVHQILKIKSGASYTTPGGEVLSNEELTIAPPPPRKYAFCSDTGYTESFADQIEGADTLYHEATFMKEFSGLAREKLHSTTVEAATLALKAKVKKLIIGHYSARYDDTELISYLDEAKAVFKETYLAKEGKVFEVG